MYNYKVDIEKFNPKDVYDGDTLWLTVDLGFHVFIKEKFRLYGINAPEIRSKNKEKALKAKQFVINKLLEAKKNNFPVFIKTQKDKKGKYGRYLAEIFINNINLNELLIIENLAEKYFP